MKFLNVWLVQMEIPDYQLSPKVTSLQELSYSVLYVIKNK